MGLNSITISFIKNNRGIYTIKVLNSPKENNIKKINKDTKMIKHI